MKQQEYIIILALLALCSSALGVNSVDDDLKVATVPSEDDLPHTTIPSDSDVEFAHFPSPPTQKSKEEPKPKNMREHATIPSEDDLPYTTIPSDSDVDSIHVPSPPTEKSKEEPKAMKKRELEFPPPHSPSMFSGFVPPMAPFNNHVPPMPPFGLSAPGPYHHFYPYVKTVKEVMPKKRWHPKERQCFHMFQRLTKMKKYLPNEKSKKVWEQLFKSYEHHCRKERSKKPMRKHVTKTSYHPFLHPYHFYGSMPHPYGPYDMGMPYYPMVGPSMNMPHFSNPFSMYEAPPAGAVKPPPEMIGDEDSFEKPEDHQMPPIGEMSKLAFPGSQPSMPNPYTMYGAAPPSAMRPPPIQRPGVMPEDQQVPPLDSLEKLAFPHMPTLPSQDLYSAAPSGARQMQMPIAGLPAFPPIYSTSSYPANAPEWFMNDKDKDILLKPERRHCEVELERLQRYKKQYPRTWYRNYGKKYMRVHARCYPEEHAEIIRHKITDLQNSMHNIDDRMKEVTDKILENQHYDSNVEELYSKEKKRKLMLNKILTAIKATDKDGNVTKLSESECHSVLSQLLHSRRTTAMPDGEWAATMDTYKKSCDIKMKKK